MGFAFAALGFTVEAAFLGAAAVVAVPHGDDDAGLFAAVLEPADAEHLLGEAAFFDNVVDVGEDGVGQIAVVGVLVGPGPQGMEAADDGEGVFAEGAGHGDDGGIAGEVRAEFDPITGHGRGFLSFCGRIGGVCGRGYPR